MILDKNGREIKDGDLIRQPHFRGARRKQFYIYHVAVDRGGRLYGVPVSELSPTVKARDGGGTFILTGDILKAVEIIDGYGDGSFWHDRQIHTVGRKP